MKRRVVITGLGVVSSTGITRDKFWESIKSGKTGINKISSFNTFKYPIKVAGEIKDFKPEKFIDEKTLSRTAKFAHFGLIATAEAFQDAKLTKESYDSEKSGVSLGTGMGGMDFALYQQDIFLKRGASKINSFITSIVVPSSVSRVISLNFQLKGPCMTFCSVCTASSDAIGYGLFSIRNGNADIMIVGGAESPISPSTFTGLCLSRFLSLKNEHIPKPFDKERDGTVVSEGAAILIIEELGHALKRGAHIYAEIIGYAATCDAYHIVNPDPEGTQGAKALNLALQDAGIKPEQVNYINAHGTGTIKNDKAETLIVKKVFGNRAYDIPISSTKSITGHLLGAAGAIEAAICAMAIKEGIVPATINYKTPDPECDLNYVPNQAVEENINVVVSNSFGIGGQNSVLVFKKHETQ